ncbi:MAG: hypothetical protein HQ525_10295 [Anaerolineae bacterium]|nr:hypothetical protein [Anaerolineae bacterium]
MTFIDLFQKVIIARAALIEGKHPSTFRFFNGFLEGNPDIAFDLYVWTVVIHDYADSLLDGEIFGQDATDFLINKFDWIKATFIKTRKREKTYTERT